MTRASQEALDVLMDDSGEDATRTINTALVGWAKIQRRFPNGMTVVENGQHVEVVFL